MQFVRNGPDLPEQLLQAHEDGRVVFFCGAGISYPARLPGFQGLVEKLYAALGATPSPIQQAALKAGQFDTAIGLLESEIAGGRETVRVAMAEILKPDLTLPHATATHEALLTLGKTRDGRTRLITTNFDRLFEEVISAKGLDLPCFQAPLLPVPKNRWDGLVYLHGLLSKAPTSSQLHSLVVSSGDFGLAYLTERWAARFVGELFRNYTVCFVGYSINDPVLRYMTDALAADRLLGESWPEMFAFGSYSKGTEEQRANEWRAKNVTPILYRELDRHSLLHKTIRTWAETYRDGIRGKERIVVECALARPLASTKQDDFVGRLLWAVSEPRGLAAQRFAELDPVPALDWLEPFNEDRYLHGDLRRFGVPPKAQHDAKLKFSLAWRPTPYDLAPRMALVDIGTLGCQWDAVMHQLARWLLRYLDEPKLLIWFAKRGGQLHQDMERLIDHRMDELWKLERDGKKAEIEQIRRSAPKAIPGPLMRTLWRLMLTGRIKSWVRHFDLFTWRRHFVRDGLTASLRLELREALTPRVSIREPFRWPDDESEPVEPTRARDFVDWDIVLSTEHVHSSLKDLPKDERWQTALPDLLDDFNGLLRDALDLMHELGGAEETSDHSYVQQPSIGEHSQNKAFHDWTALIELTRDAWVATAEQSAERAWHAAERWMIPPYPLFRRMAFFAAAFGSVVPPRRGLDWLLSRDRWWLWSVETQREAMRLLIALAPRLNASEISELQLAILAGPPRRMFRDDLGGEDWLRLVARETWLRLCKLVDAGVALEPAAAQRRDEVESTYPDLKAPKGDEQDEFPFWMERGWGGERDPWRTSISTPRTRTGLLKYLRENPVLEQSKQDDWRQRCSDSPQTTAYVLCVLAREQVWPADRWRDALQAWSEEKLRASSWLHMGPVVSRMPDEVLSQVVRPIAYWLRAIATEIGVHEGDFLALARRILHVDIDDDVDDEDPVSRAINHPIGHLTESLLHWWNRGELEDGQGLSRELKALFTQICDLAVARFRHGRLLLCTHVIALFRVDPDWTADNLLPLFDWRNPNTEARSAWQGFLWSPRLYRPLMERLKFPFLDTANHFAKLGEFKDQYASLLTFAALEPRDVFTTLELAKATHALPPEGLREAAQALVRTLESSGQQQAEYWSNRVVPYFRSVWPKTKGHISLSIAEAMARLCVATGDSFPEAVSILRFWLAPPEHPDYVVHRLHLAGLDAKFPREALDFLDRVVADPPQWLPSDLQVCLEVISRSSPQLVDDSRYLRLSANVRQRGG